MILTEQPTVWASNVRSREQAKVYMLGSELDATYFYGLL